MAQVALGWLLTRPAVTSVVIGVSSLDQLHDNLVAPGIQLTDQDLSELDEVSKQPPAYPNWIQAAFALARFPAGNR